jgi:hypothetical protein
LENFHILYRNSNSYYSSIPSIIIDGAHQEDVENNIIRQRTAPDVSLLPWSCAYIEPKERVKFHRQSRATMQWLISVALAVLAVVRKY